MKISTHHFEHLSNTITSVLATHNANDELVNAYESGEFARSDKVKDLQRRFCFDVLYGAGLNKFVCDELYPYMNDNHIYTALKAICPKVERKY